MKGFKAMFLYFQQAWFLHDFKKVDPRVMVWPPVTYQSIRDGSSIFPAAMISQF